MIVMWLKKQCGNMENSKVIAPGMFKLNVSQCVSPISISKSSCDFKNVEIKLKRKRHLDTFSSVRRPKHSNVVWKKKGSSNISNVGLSAVSVLNLNKNIKRYSRKDLLACNNSHLGETSSDYMCNDAMNVSCNPRLCDMLDDNNFFIFDDVNVRISPVSKMPFRKKPRDSMQVRSKSNMIKSLPRTVHKWLPKLQPLAEPVAKWFPRVLFYLLQIVQICLWIIDTGCSKHMTGNRALLMNFVEKFLGTVRFGNNDFAVIAGYGDVIIGSMTIKKVYYVEGLGHNLFSVGQFCDKGLEVAFRKSTCFVRNEDGVDLLTGLEIAFRKSTCFVRNEDGVDLLTGDRSSNLYTIALNEVASNSSTCLLAKASSSQSWLWHQRLSHLNFATINNLVKNNLVQDLPKMNFEKDHLEAARTMLTFANLPSFLWAEAIATASLAEAIATTYEASDVIISFIKKTQVNLQLQVQRVRTDNGTEFKNKTLAKFFDELKAKGDIGVFVGYSKESAAFRIYNKRTRKIHESVNVNFDEISEMASKQFSLEPGLSNLNETGKSSNLSVSQIMKSSTTNVETPINNEVFHEVSESFQGESSSSSLNDDVQQSPE
nr:hypothetical protein [Tanacetum cinerariifolium]